MIGLEISLLIVPHNQNGVTQKRKTFLMVIPFLSNVPQQNYKLIEIKLKKQPTYLNCFVQGNSYEDLNIEQRQGFSHSPLIGTIHAINDFGLTSTHCFSSRVFEKLQLIPIKLDSTTNGDKTSKKIKVLIF